MAVIEATRPAFWVQLAASAQPPAKSALSNWQLATRQIQLRKVPLVFFRVLCGKSPVFSAPPPLRGERRSRHAR